MILFLMHNPVQFFFGYFWSNVHKENLASKIYFLWGCNLSITSKGGQLQLELNLSDTLLQQFLESGSQILPVSPGVAEEH